MAQMHTAQHHDFSIGHFFGSIVDFFIGISDNNSRVHQAENLEHLSDAQLAERGLKREDIPRHVFKDFFAA